MLKIKKFFCLSSKDLSAKSLSVTEIAERMERTDENSLRLPRSFAKSVTQIMESEAFLINKQFESNSKPYGKDK